MTDRRSRTRWLRAIVIPVVSSILAAGTHLLPAEPVTMTGAQVAVAVEAEVVAPPAPPVVEEPAEAEPPAPASEPAQAPASEPEPASPAPEPDPCAGALAWVAGAGLPLPESVGYHCPSTQFAHQGAACWDEWPCPGSGFIAINMELLAGATPEYLRHVVAHEMCHILDFRSKGWTTEAGADACAAAYGA